MKKLLTTLLLVGSFTGVSATEEWHGYFGIGGELEQARTSPRGNGYAKMSPMIEFSTWNQHGFSLFGKILNTYKGDQDLDTNGSKGYLVELWPTYSTSLNNKLSGWIAFPLKTEKYSDDENGNKQPGYFSLGIAPGISYNFTNKISGFAKTYYKYDVQTYSGVDKENYLESEVGLSYKFNDVYKLNVGAVYKKFDDRYAWWSNSRQDADKVNIDEILGKMSLEINMPSYNFKFTPYMEFGGYYDNTEFSNGNRSIWDERDSYKFGFLFDKQINDSWKILGEIYWRKHFVDTENTQFDKDTYYTKLIIAHTF